MKDNIDFELIFHNYMLSKIISSFNFTRYRICDRIQVRILFIVTYKI